MGCRALTALGALRPRLAAVLLATALIASCAEAVDPYPLPAEPPRTAQLNPARVGEPVNAILLYVEVRPGDRIELLGAEAVGSVDGAAVRFLVSRPVVHDDGSQVIGETFEDLLGNTLEAVSADPGPDNTIGIGAELTATRPGRYEIRTVRLHFRINGGEQRVGEGISVRWTVCADDPAPADCPEDAPA